MNRRILLAAVTAAACPALVVAGSLPARAGPPGAMPLRPPEAQTAQGPHGGRPQANRIRVGGGFHGGGYLYRTGGFRYPSPLQRSVFPSDACYGIYSAMVQPGGMYALNMRLPQAGSDTHVYLADRWPLGRNVGLRRLPLNGRGSPLARGLYRWRFGIAPGSYGSVVYVVVVAPWLCGGTSPYYGIAIDPWQARGGYGGGAMPVMQADGPMQLNLAPENNNGEESNARSQTRLPLPGDIVGNPDFTRGLLDWQAVSGGRPAANADFVRATSQGIELSGRSPDSGVRQSLDANVANASAIILQASLKVTPAHESHATSAPALTIAICYTDADGASHCGAGAFQRRFEALPPGVNAGAGVQHVPVGVWYQETYDLMHIDPRPVRIDSIALFAPREAGARAWVRDVHLLVRHG